MYKLSLSYFLFNITIFFSFFKNILNACNYTDINGINILDTDNSTFLGLLTGDTAKQECFSLSNSLVQKELCCYNKKTNKCFSQTQTKTTTEIINGTDIIEVSEGINETNGTGRIRRVEETEENNDSNIECPNEKNTLFNNCGLAGIYEPVSAETCKEISLVQGHCCFVKIKSGEKVCVRTKKLNKEKNTVTDEIKSYIGSYGTTFDIESVECNCNFLQFYSLLLMISVIGQCFLL